MNLAKKTWVKLKRGFIADPKHRRQIGECVWLYLHIVDRAEHSTGIVEEWKDADEAVDMQMPVRTIRDQRQKLEAAGYIKTTHKQRGLRLQVTKWTDFTSRQSDTITSPSKSPDVDKSEPQTDIIVSPTNAILGDTPGVSLRVTPKCQSEIQSDTQSGNGVSPTSCFIHDTMGISHEREAEGAARTPRFFDGKPAPDTIDQSVIALYDTWYPGESKHLSIIQQEQISLAFAKRPDAEACLRYCATNGIKAHRILTIIEILESGDYLPRNEKKPARSSDQWRQHHATIIRRILEGMPKTDERRPGLQKILAHLPTCTREQFDGYMQQLAEVGIDVS